ncbi:MAG: biosynthetic arginine decarboxylase [Planctomycetes bacterium]|nr:biosynthetic arginine decarboxylase [Planctomycetota bacterium]
MQEQWTVSDSNELYGVAQWGRNLFSINPQGRLVVHPTGQPESFIDLKSLVDEIEARGIGAPMLIRFPDILKQRMVELNECFRAAITEQNYKGEYRGVFPIKVNQERQVVQSIVEFGKPYHFGLEAGSKPELMTTLALLDSNEALIVCNGYKDEEYIELALLATKLGRKVVIVLEKLSELDLVLQLSKKDQVKPLIGMRAKLLARGTGRWRTTSGDNSKFGLTAYEMLQVVDRLKQENLLDSLQLLHFHIGSQISGIRNLKEALQEAARFYVELKKLGAGLSYLDVGGGLAVDYDGSQTRYETSMNYSVQEYANNVVFHVMDVCEQAGVAHPHLVSESGRALAAHHSMLVFNVLGVSEITGVNGVDPEKAKLSDDDPNVLYNLQETLQTVSRKNFREAYHDSAQLREEAATLFKLGYMTLQQRALSDQLYWAICRKVLQVVRTLKNVPEDLEGLERSMAGTYFCNFSVFQSVPDYWAIDHLFPIMPIHRLNERPTVRGVLADITCDSDGKVDSFIGSHDVRRVLELHPMGSEGYFLGIFLLGAYQEILGDLHNLFGDTNAVLISAEGQGGYKIEHVDEGDTVEEVLRYVSYDKADLLHRLRSSAEEALRAGRMTLEETRRFVKMYQEGLDGYTYLEGPGGEVASIAAATATNGTSTAVPPAPAAPAAGASEGDAVGAGVPNAPGSPPQNAK